MKIRDLYLCCSNTSHNAVYHIYETTNPEPYFKGEPSAWVYEMTEMPNDLYYDREVVYFRIINEVTVHVLLKVGEEA